MTDPVVAAGKFSGHFRFGSIQIVFIDGYSYEREAIKKWFEDGNRTSPMTNEPLENVNLLPNRTLTLLIKKYLS